MGTEHSIASTRPGTPGLDVFMTGESRQVRLPFTTHLEERLVLFLEYHPHVRSYQRGDASVACASTYDLAVPCGTPYRINYVFEGKPHEYLPDFVGTLCDGGLLITEAGRKSEKSQERRVLDWHRWQPFRTAPPKLAVPACTTTAFRDVSRNRCCSFTRVALRGHVLCQRVSPAFWPFLV